MNVIIVQTILIRMLDIACVNWSTQSPSWQSGKATSGGWINIKMSSYQYRKSHCGDKTILRPSYLHNGITYTDKMTSLYWIRAHLVCLCLHYTPLHETKGPETHYPHLKTCLACISFAHFKKHKWACYSYVMSDWILGTWEMLWKTSYNAYDMYYHHGIQLEK